MKILAFSGFVMCIILVALSIYRIIFGEVQVDTGIDISEVPSIRMMIKEGEKTSYCMVNKNNGITTFSCSDTIPEGW